MSAPFAANVLRHPQGGNDPNFANVSLLMHFDGTNGSTAFIDSSSNGFSITRTGTVLSTTNPKFGTACGLFSSTGDRFTTPANVAFNFGTGDFTVEFWINSSQTGRADVIGLNAAFGAANWWGLLFNVSASGQMSAYENGNQRINATATGWNDGNYHHVALTRSGNSVKLFLDGVQVGSTWTTTFTYGNSTVGLEVGVNNDNSTGQLVGRLDDLRVTKGVARYTANFTPPASPFPNF